jgi:hypothetical protein
MAIATPHASPVPNLGAIALRTYPHYSAANQT